MGSAPKYLRLVLFLAALLLLVLFLISQPVGRPVGSRTDGAGGSAGAVAAAAGTGFLPDDGRGGGHQVEVVSGEDNAGGGLRSLASMVDSFRVLLVGLKAGRGGGELAVAGYGLAPAPAPMEAETAAPAPVRLPARGYSRSPLPRPSRIPPLDDADLRKAGAARARALWIVVAAAVSAAATLAIVALTVALVRHRSRRGRTVTGGGVAWGKVGFDPGAELFYLDTFAPGLPAQISGPEQSSGSVGGSSTPSRSPASSPRDASGESEDDHESFHSLSVCNSHPSPLRHSDASDASDPAESPPSPAFAPPFALKPPSSPPRGLGFGRRVSFCPELSPSQPPLTKLASAASSSPGIHDGGGASCSSPPPPPSHGSSRSLDSRLPSSSPCMESGGPAAATTQTREATPSSSASNTAAASSATAMPTVGNGCGPGPLLPPATPFLPPPPPPPPPVPPPPTPPSTKKAGSPGQAPPPPRPFQPSASTPVGKDGSPLPKLKPLHWDKVRAAPDRSMVWDKIRSSSSFELDEEMIESLFGYNLQGSGRSEEARSKASSSPSKHVLEPKRLQNFTILLKALNATSDQICGALLTGTGLCAQQLEALVKMAPTKEEEEKLICFDGGAGELDPVERFVRGMLGIPLCFLRLEAMLYRETFDDEVAHLKKSFETLEEACTELKSSRLFLRLLDAVLKTGNRMNVGTTRGGAMAFKLDALLKLADVKGTDGKTTLLHFVVQEIVRSEGAAAAGEEDDCRTMGLELVAGLSTELRHVKTTAGVDLGALAGSVCNLAAGLRSLQHLLERHEIGRGEFGQAMRSFSGYAGRAIGELQEEEARVFRRVREITEYYHGDVVGKEEGNPLGIFVVVRDFLGLLERVCREVWSSKGHHQHSPAMAVPFK